MNYDYEKYQAMLRVEQLISKLVEQQQQDRVCYRCVMMLPQEPLVPVIPEAAVPEQPAEETLYNRYRAALYLEKSESSITRWRKSGQLNYIMEGAEIRYPESMLDAFHLKKWGFPKKKNENSKKE